MLNACTKWLAKQGWDEAFRGRLPELVETQERYRVAAEAGQLLALLISEVGAQSVDPDKGRLNATYDRAFVGGGGRKLYDAIKAAAIHGSCTVCGVGEASTLDHHAPKDSFPLLALTPLNLVPACGPCNQGKSKNFSTVAAEEPFHPYFDDLGAVRWLYADVCRVAGGGAVEFSVRPPADWSKIKAERLFHHFTRHKLGKKYGYQASRRLATRRRKDTRLLESSGAEVLRATLIEDADSCAVVDPNGWETALLYALADSDWYINGGMKEI
ncbi:HNH endonuclease [Streptomyces sp. NPDC048751]|uniref:HNH endonuclease n=1 Tax=Streptomyces sp. NPDC048751 TaxID=3365591 RepID=UPI0037219DCF